MAEQIVQLGLGECPVCDAGVLAARRQPVILPIGGLPQPDLSVLSPHRGANVLFMVAVTCNLCGHTLLFDSERFSSGDEPILEDE